MNDPTTPPSPHVCPGCDEPVPAGFRICRDCARRTDQELLYLLLRELRALKAGQYQVAEWIVEGELTDWPSSDEAEFAIGKPREGGVDATAEEEKGEGGDTEAP